MKFIDALKCPDPPIASIILNTYNHEKYVGECLDSILSQQVEFSCELIIYDDASTDNSVDLIEEIIGDVTNVTKIYSETNLYSKDKIASGKAITEILGALDSKVFFRIEGDDYWIGSNYRIQKMVDFMLSNLEYSFCYTDTFKHISDELQISERSRFLLPDSLKNELSIDDLLLGKFAYINLGAICFRNVHVEYPPEYYISPNKDTWAPYLWSDFGPGHFLADCGDLFYRYNGEGVWSSLSESEVTSSRVVFACQLISHMLRHKNNNGALFNAYRLKPLLNNNPYLKLP